MRAAVGQEKWNPRGFDGYSEWYPKTEAFELEAGMNVSAQFQVQWEKGLECVCEILRPHAHRTTVIFFRGFLGNWMPGNLSAPCREMRKLGFDAWIMPTHSGASVNPNVERAIHLLKRRPIRENLICCSHSKGSIECLKTLLQMENVRSKCRGVFMSQSPYGPSLVLESILRGRHRELVFPMRRRIAEATQKVGLLLAQARQGGLELTRDLWLSVISGLDLQEIHFPILQTASWSIQPTAWLDSFHERLSEIAPGVAHDGQFLLKDLLWPKIPHLLLPEIDHAQPAMGGFGFDHVRYWLTYLSMELK